MKTKARRITIVDRSGKAPKSKVVSSSKRKKGRVSGLTRPVEAVIRCVVETQLEGARQYMRRHKRSNRKRRDGWLPDFLGNVYYSQRKAYNRARDVLGLKFLPKA